MKCKKCGTEFQEGLFCPECGTKMEVELSKEEQELLDRGNKEREILLAKQRAEQEKIAKEREDAEREECERRRIAEQEHIEQERLKQEKIKQEKMEKKKENEGKTMAFLSLCCGIISLCTLGCFFIPEILGIIFAFNGKKQGVMRGKAKAGLICSIISSLIMVLIVVLGILQ